MTSNEKTAGLKALLFDVDGILTDNGLYVDEEGRTQKKFCILDGAGIKLAHMAGLMTGLPLGLIVVREVMTAEPATVASDDSLADAHAQMRESQVRRLPVVDDGGAVVGVLSLNDLVNEAFGGRSKAAQKRQRDAAKTLAEICIPHETIETEQATEA